ncbi:hypothetical protein Daura_45495 [Dactylosporangium aurantiacum]|uniref:Uncharacterized protein n=1 Tax=Dactylosporangium aurantiacum TaxID=35754 RepID=A0A9Q9MEU7_9ACTN|nr:hypothetical protein [Dactylosporangium aurantiacum]MDG6108062.1 hypothetical protein [Dactylosporangium aurantiacum]UWZ53694.1 hypothetical protein Daura_45495 [Dactylosporangium aurantiacum]
MSALLAVLADVRAMLARPGNDYSWSSFVDAEAALEEIDAAVAVVLSGGTPTACHVLFAPTGPIQEVALSSGWGDEFLTLAARFDAAVRSL